MNLSTIKARVDSLLATASQRPSISLYSTLLHGTIGVVQALYGPDSSQERELRAYTQRLRDNALVMNLQTPGQSIEAIRGTLESIKAEMDTGFVGSLRATLTGEILTDLIKLARTVLMEPGDDAKNVASVLVAAAFEDVLRRLTDLKGLGHQERLQDVITTLKTAGVVQGAEIGIAQGYLSFRNHALHAQWNVIDRPEVESCLAFTEQIILKHLT